MVKILSGDQVKELDLAHIKTNHISSLDLMEKAALGFVDWFKSEFSVEGLPISVFCGAGSNGGDGFAISRLLHKLGFEVTVFLCFAEDHSLGPDASSNFKLLPHDLLIKSWADFIPSCDCVIVDAFIGVGFKDSLRPEALLIIEQMNKSQSKVISVDIPSGLPSDGILNGNCVRANCTVTFAFPKLSLLFPEHSSFVGEMVLVDIGIQDETYGLFDADFYYLQRKDVPFFHHQFHRFSHKGDFGKALMIGGSKGKMGAVFLCSKSALRTGSGLVSCVIDSEERFILQTSVPEVMCRWENQVNFLEFDAIGVGPGWGIEGRRASLENLLDHYPRPLVLDADAISLLSLHPDLIPKIPMGSILTPHLGEFERLLGKCSNQLERLKKAREFCMTFGLNLVIKGANSVICLSDGRQIFNSSGTPYLATAGSGDVLTGMITSFLGQSYSSEQAMICGVFHHGLAGELAGYKKRRGTVASDIIEAIPDTYIALEIS